MLFSTFTMEKNLLYYKGGEFLAHKGWHHRRMYHKGDYALILCIKGPIYLQIGDQRYTLNAHEDDMTEKVKASTSKKRQIFLPRYFKLADYEEATILIHQILSIHNELSFIEERDYLVSALLIQLYKSYFNRPDVNEDSSRINSLKEWIRANMSSTLTVAEIADRSHLNPDYLTRLFKQCTGLTTLQYLNHVKIEVATLLLIRTDMSIKQIADNSYFNDPKVFMRRFKSATGLSPTEYRKSYNLIHLNNPHVDPQIPIPKRIADSIDYNPENGDIPE